MTANNLHSQRHAFVSPTIFPRLSRHASTLAYARQVPKGLVSDFLSSKGLPGKTIPGLPTAHNEHPQSLTYPSGRPVTNPPLSPSSRFQAPFVTNSSFP